MASPILLALILIAASTQNGFIPGKTWPDIDANELRVNLPDIIANIRDTIAGIDWSQIIDSVRNIIENVPSIIERLREVVANIPALLPRIIEAILGRLPEIVAGLPGRLPEIIENIAGRLPDLVDRLPELVSRLQELIDRLQDIIGNISIDTSEIVAIVTDIIERIREVIGEANWDAILDLLPDIDWPEIVGQLPDIIANLPDIIANLPDIIARLPELIERLPEIIANLPEIDWPSIIDKIPIDRDPGTKTHIREHPSLVQVEVGFGNLWLQGCTGNILNSLYILSAARCFSGRLYEPRIRRVRAGANSRGGLGVVFPVSRAVVHPTFGQNGFDGDIAVVAIRGRFPLFGNINSIGIPNAGVFFPGGSRVTTAGWGSTAQGRPISNRDLYTVNLAVVDNAGCTQKYANLPVNITVTRNMICAGRPVSGGRNADLRDAGGPLYYDVNGNDVLVGVLSFGFYIGNNSFPLVATSVSSYTNWIVTTAV